MLVRGTSDDGEVRGTELETTDDRTDYLAIQRVYRAAYKSSVGSHISLTTEDRLSNIHRIVRLAGRSSPHCCLSPLMRCEHLAPDCLFLFLFPISHSYHPSFAGIAALVPDNRPPLQQVVPSCSTPVTIRMDND